ncbi:TPA: hypothetical protein DIC40_08530 [Patescibacteria group bacterium]|nr:hypothetical protein [Candidatus Gracilibacteria bacterium]
MPELLNLPRTAFNEERSIKISQLLQSLDNDNNPDNGIIITPEVINAITQTGSIENININTVVTSVGKTVRNTVDVQEHLGGTLKEQFMIGVSLVKDIKI